MKDCWKNHCRRHDRTMKIMMIKKNVNLLNNFFLRINKQINEPEHLSIFLSFSFPVYFHCPPPLIIIIIGRLNFFLLELLWLWYIVIWWCWCQDYWLYLFIYFSFCTFIKYSICFFMVINITSFILP